MKKIDWEGVEREYRTGQLSVREIGRQYRVSHVTIIRKARKNGWVQDLKARTEKKMATTLVAATKHATNINAGEDRKLIAEVVDRGNGVIAIHRNDIRQLREIGSTLMGKLENVFAIEDTIELGGDELRRHFPLKEASEIFRNLSQAMAKCIPLERQAFNIPDTPSRLEVLGKVEHTISPQEREMLKEIAFRRGTAARKGNI